MLKWFMRHPRLHPIFVFILSLAGFSLLISWNSFLDPDAFYHAKVSILLWEHGPLHSFPWLDLTTLGTTFADHHFLFHVIEAPIIQLVGWATAIRVTAVLLLALFTTVFYICLRSLNISSPWIWTLFLATTHPLLVRGLLGKATPLAITLFAAGLTATWLRKRWIVFVVMALFTLSHGGWIYLLGCIVLLAIGDICFRKIVLEQSWRETVGDSYWKEILVALAGIVLGFILHPNSSHLVSFLWIQIVKIGLGTPFQHVTLGREWLAPSLSSVIASFGPWIIAGIVGLAGILLAPRKPLDKDHARAAIAFALPAAALLALTFKSRRNAEYLAPALALWIPWLWNLIDIKKYWNDVRETFSPRLRPIIMGTLCLTFGALVIRNTWAAYRDLHERGYPDNAFQEAMAPVVARANPGDRVFHSDWDEFPVLFMIDDRVRYIAGLDPTFLYEASSTLSDAYRDLTWPSNTSTREQAWDLIHDRLQARFIFVAHDHPALAELLRTDPRYELLKETADATTFEVHD